MLSRETVNRLAPSLPLVPHAAQGCRMVYPLGDKEAVEVTAADLARLDPDEFLNDTVIDYYTKCAAVLCAMS